MSEYTNLSPTGHTLFDIARGMMAEATPVNIFGTNPAVGDGAYETIWEYGGKYVYPTQPLVMTAVSSNAGDTSMPVLINGLDADYNEISETIILNAVDATTPVTGTKEFFRINSTVILSGSNLGNISITNSAVVYSYITIGSGLSQACIYTVPAKSSLYLFRIDANSATTNGQKYLTLRNETVTSAGRALHVAKVTFAESSVSYDRQVPFRITEKTDFQFECVSSSSTNEVAVLVEGILLKDPSDLRR